MQLVESQTLKRKTGARQPILPTLSYVAAADSGRLLDNAFDVLFKETLKQIGDLTTTDN